MNLRFSKFPFSLRTFGIVLLLCAASVQSHAQPQLISSLGKEFYCMVMKFNGGTNAPPYIRLFLSSPTAAIATITIESPPFSQTVNIAPNVVTTVELPMGVQDSTYEAATRQAIHIVSDTDIAVYEIYHKQFSTDS